MSKNLLENTIAMFPLILSAYFIFESVATTSAQSAIVVFGILIVVFIGKIINTIAKENKSDEDFNDNEEGDDFGDDDPDEDDYDTNNKKIMDMCSDIFGLGYKVNVLPEINTLIFSFVGFYINGKIFEGSNDVSPKQLLILLFLHFMIIFNGFLKINNKMCKVGLEILIGSYIFGVILAFSYYHLVKAIQGGENNLVYSKQSLNASGQPKCGLNKKKQFKCRKVFRPKNNTTAPANAPATAPETTATSA